LFSCHRHCLWSNQQNLGCARQICQDGNPVKSDDASLSEGKALWTKHCQSCHGKTGAGDGPKAAQLKTQPEDIKTAEVQKQPDGALFYKTSEGRDDMPSFKKKIPEEQDMWNLVNYMRSLK